MNLNQKNVSEAEKILLLASKDLIAFGKLFLPDDFSSCKARVQSNI